MTGPGDRPLTGAPVPSSRGQLPGLPASSAGLGSSCRTGSTRTPGDEQRARRRPTTSAPCPRRKGGAEGLRRVGRVDPRLPPRGKRLDDPLVADSSTKSAQSPAPRTVGDGRASSRLPLQGASSRRRDSRTCRAKLPRPRHRRRRPPAASRGSGPNPRRRPWSSTDGRGRPVHRQVTDLVAEPVDEEHPAVGRLAKVLRRPDRQEEALVAVVE